MEAKAARLSLQRIPDASALEACVRNELGRLADGDPQLSRTNQKSLTECCKHAATLGAKAVILQRRIQDPDYLAEFTAYYSRQFAHVGRHCVRVHFFSVEPTGDDVLAFLDAPNSASSYLGFITLRPVVRTPVGATILKAPDKSVFVRCTDDFPVYLAGLKLNVRGTPFMQQDNAVGACAQAAIWMGLRTMRRREGDRAHNPAQITGAATRYTLSGRILPNRTGLTVPQVIEAVRSSGYSPHLIPLRTSGVTTTPLTPGDRDRARQVLHAYVESQIPVLLALFPASSAGHAVVVIGHTLSHKPVFPSEVGGSLPRGIAISLTHAVSWVPSFVIHNDNSGPYLPLKEESKGAPGYALDQASAAIPLLPVDVFMSGEEALEFALALWEPVFDALTQTLQPDEAMAMSKQLAIRLLLLEKRQVRAWAARSNAAEEVRSTLRMEDLPRRVWILEIHLADCYGDHVAKNAESMVGFIVLDSTSDTAEGAMVMLYLNLPAFTPEPLGSLLIARSRKDWEVVGVPKTPPTSPFRDSP